MDCRITSINETRRGRAGFTLVEVMVAAGISSLLMMVLASFSLYGARTCSSLANYSDLESQSRIAVDRVTQQIRQSRGLVSGTATNLVFKNADGNPFEFYYDADGKTLYRIENGVSTALLTGCDYMKFDLFQRNPKPGTYDAYPMAVPGTCKLVQFTWVCSRNILGARMNTETVQSAKIVIRKRS